MSTHLANPIEVLIVGAGPVGLTMACELARHGVPCQIVDSRERPTDESRAIAVQSRTLEIFENIGVVGPVLAQGKKIHGLSAYAGRRIVHVSLDFEVQETPYPFVVSLPQAQTERILIDLLSSHGVNVQRAAHLAELRPESDSVVALIDGPAGN